MSSVDPVENLAGDLTVESRAKVTEGLCRRLLVRAWHIGRTRIFWGWRFYSLGNRSVLGRSLQVNNPRVVAIGSRVTISNQFILADLCPGMKEVPKIIIGDGCIILYRRWRHSICLLFPFWSAYSITLV